MFLIKGDGVIIEHIGEGITYFKFLASANYLKINLFLTTNGLNITYSLASSSFQNNWQCGYLYSSFYNTYIYSYIYGNFIKFTKAEFRAQISTGKLYFGSSLNNSFIGFIYDVSILNFVYSYIVYYPPPSICNFNQYAFNWICYDCDASCSTWPWCKRSSCGICYSETCSSWFGPLMEHCTECNNGNTPPNCRIGSNCLTGLEFACTSCVNGYTLIKGILTLPPYNYDNITLDTPVIDIKFITFQKHYSNIFGNGINHETYAPFNNPEADDPIPIKSRGMYFNTYNFLRSSAPLTLNYEFTIALWYYNINIGNIWCQNSFFAKIYIICLL